MVIHNIIIWSPVMPSGKFARSPSQFSTISAHSRSCAAISLNVFFMSVIYLFIIIYCPGSSSPGRFYFGHLLSIKHQPSIYQASAQYDHVCSFDTPYLFRYVSSLFLKAFRTLASSARYKLRSVSVAILTVSSRPRFRYSGPLQKYTQTRPGLY